MNDDTLEALVKQVESLDRERRRVALAAFQRLSQLDRELWELGRDTFDSEEAAAGWFSEPVYSLGDDVPLTLLLTDKREKVVNCLYQIQHGVTA